MTTHEHYEKVINYFNINEDNRTSVIAKHFKLTKKQVDTILDLYLSKKANYIGEIPNQKKSKKDNTSIEVYENNILIGSFKSCLLASEFLGLKFHHTIMKGLKGIEECTIDHYTIGRTITYKRV